MAAPVPGQKKQYIIGLDYGTTNTSVAYYAFLRNAPPVESIALVKTVQNWPDDPLHGGSSQVPSKTSYPKLPQRAMPTIIDNSHDDHQPFNRSRGSKLRNIRSQPGNESFHTPVVLQQESQDSDTFLYGHEVDEYALRNPTRDTSRQLERAKLMLVEASHTQIDRKRIQPILANLMKLSHIEKHSPHGTVDGSEPEDVKDAIVHFFCTSVPAYKDIPAIWSPKATHILQEIVISAIQMTGFCQLRHGCLDDLFIVTEPEAAATFLMATNAKIIPGEAFMVLDCGGGTIDASTYTTVDDQPLRLSEAIVSPAGDNCGGSYVDANFEKCITDRLKDEDHLDQGKHDRPLKIAQVVRRFETREKTKVDIATRPTSNFFIPGLRANLAKRFKEDELILDVTDYNQIFLPPLQRASRLMKEQLTSAHNKNKPVKKIFLIGGFGAAPSLYSFLSSELAQYVKRFDLNYDVELVKNDPQTCMSAIASAAVLRGMNRSNGPKRIAVRSFGFLRVHCYDPDNFVGHRHAKPKGDKFTGDEIVIGIDYFLIKGRLINTHHDYPALSCMHRFDVDEVADDSRLICEELLYASDTATQSQYPVNSPMNSDARIIGRVESDMTFLLQRDDLKIVPAHVYENGKSFGNPYYKLEYDLVPKIRGKHLIYEARWPAGTGNNQVIKSERVSIISAFKPGTA